MALLVDENKLAGLLDEMYWLGVRNMGMITEGKYNFKETFEEARERIIQECKKPLDNDPKT
jgi:hypothetical protein